MKFSNKKNYKRRAKRDSFASQDVTCPLCGKLVRSRGLLGHIRLYHQIDELQPKEYSKDKSIDNCCAIISYGNKQLNSLYFIENEHERKREAWHLFGTIISQVHNELKLNQYGKENRPFEF